MFVNHQFGDFLYSKDPATRHRNAEAIKQLSPTRGQQQQQLARSPQSQTAYEQWWYAQRDEIVRKLEQDDGNATPSPQQRSPGQLLQNSQSRFGAAAINRNNSSSDEAVCKSCNGSIPRSANVGSGSQEVSPVRNTQIKATGATAATSPSSSSTSSHPSPARVPGTDFEALHPSHLYLHHHDVINHVHEDMVRNPNSVEQRRLLEEEAKRSPSRHDANMTAYEKWWYEERDRILAYVESHSKQ